MLVARSFWRKIILSFLLLNQKTETELCVASSVVSRHSSASTRKVATRQLGKSVPVE